MPLSNRFAVRWTMVFLIGAALVAGCYRYIDIPLARWAHHHQLRQYGLFHGLQALADGLVLLAPVMLVGLLGAYYHFAGDVLAGTLLGVFVTSLVLRGDVRAPELRSPHRD